MEDNLDEWKFAPIIVSTNMERLNIARLKARLWAEENNTYVFKWRCKLKNQQNRPSSSAMNKITEDNAFFWQFWIAGAPANLSHNINGDLALVNGAPITLHSLTWDDEKEFIRIQELTKEDSALPFGSEIEIAQPLAINVAVDKSLDGKPVSRRRQLQLNQLQQFSIVEDKIVLPITTAIAPSSGNKNKKFTYKTGNLISPIATAEVSQPFPFDLAFAITVHKAQGRTMDRVVVDLSSHPTYITQMNFAAVFVAMSRVRNRNHLRLLPHPGNRNQHYQHLPLLKISQAVMAFYHGFSGNPSDGLH
jgi:hypothetical protein